MPISYTTYANKKHDYSSNNGLDTAKWDMQDINSSHKLMLDRATMSQLFAVVDSPGSTQQMDILKLLNTIGQSTAVSKKPADLKKLGEELKEKLKAMNLAKKELAAKEKEVTTELAAKKTELSKATSAAQKTKIEKQIKALEKKLKQVKEASTYSTKMLKSLIAKTKDAKKARAEAKKALEAKHKDSSTGQFKTPGDQTAFEAAMKLVDDGVFTELDSLVNEGEELLKDPATAASKPGSSTQKKAASTGGASNSGAGQSATSPDVSGQSKAANGPADDGAFDPMKMLQMNNAFDSRASAMDEAMKMQGQSNKMMTMLLYLSRMAMSGDIGSMYRFMQFVGTIINRDKASQNVQLADKLIKLQGVSRALTQQLVDTPSYDKDDPQVAYDFQKTMETIKADQGMIATEQKLIASMLQEMAQISEQMFNLQKSLLDVNGNIMKNSRFG